MPALPRDFVDRWTTLHQRAARPLRWLAGHGVWSAAVLATTAYAVLLAAHERFYDRLGVTAAEAGLGREQLMTGPLLGVILLGIGLAAVLAAVYAFAMLILLVGNALFVLGERLVRARTASRGSGAGRAEHRLGPGWSVQAAQAPSSRPREAPAFVLLGAPDAVWLYLTLVVSGVLALVLTVAVLFARAEDAADAVHHGARLSEEEVWGLPVLHAQGHAVQGPRAGLPGGDPACLSLLAAKDGRWLLWDVRHERSWEVAAPPGGRELTSAAGEAPARCAPAPRIPTGAHSLAHASAIADVRASAAGFGWQARLPRGWMTFVDAGGRRALGPPSASRPLWALTDAAAVTLRCRGRRCAARWFTVAAGGRAPERSAVRLPAGCSPTALAAGPGHTLWLATRGARCATGLLRVAPDSWPTAVARGERVTAVAAGGAGVAWAADDGATWRVRWRARGRPVRTIWQNGRRADGDDVAVSALAVAGGRVRFVRSWAGTPAARINTLFECRGGCRPIADQTPGRRWGGPPVDAAVFGGDLVVTDGRAVARIALSQLRRSLP